VALRVVRVLKVFRVHKVFKEDLFKVLKVYLDHRVSKVSKEEWVREHREPLVFKDLKVKMVLLEPMVLRVRKVLLGLLVDQIHN
jgi:hypothetical protein